MSIRLIFLLLSLAAIFYNLFNLSIPLVYKFYPWFTNYDYYYLYEAAKNYIIDGVPQIKYWPNSSAGLDLFVWDKFSQVLTYALILKIIGLDLSNIFLIDSIFKIISFFIIFFSMLMISIKKSWIVLVVGLLCYDPVAYFFFINKQYYGLAYGFLFACYIYLALSFSGLKSGQFFLILNGILSSVFFFWFIPIGILFYFSVTLIVLGAMFKKDISKKALVKKIFLFFLGSLIGLISLYLANNSLSDFLKLKVNFFSALSVYINGTESISFWKQRIIFILDTIFPSQGFSLVLPTILFLFFIRLKDYFNKNILNVSKESLVIIDSVIFVSIAYLLEGLIFPNNMYLARMSWSFPLLFYLVVRIFLDKHFNNIKKIFILFILFYTFLYMSFVFSKNFLNIKFAWLLAILFGAASLFISIKKITLILKFCQNKNIIKFLSLVAIIFAILRWEQFTVYKNRYHSADIMEISNYFINKSYDGYVVSNVPIGVFNHDIKVHLTQSYKGLINGVVAKPASFFLYFTKYEDFFLCENFLFKYGLHIYEGTQVERVGNNFSVCIGTPVTKKIYNKKIKHLDNLSDPIILDYLRNKQ
jgi:hypothetical protein